MTQSELFYNLNKRPFDILVAGAALLVLAPVMAITALAVRHFMGSPILFRHPRPGLNEVVFDCLKFRSMKSSHGPDGKLLSEFERLTPFGKFLRRTSLDELPQLWTVLIGDMSLVGPRPLEVRYLNRYSAEQRRRQTVMPGITGWAQINGRNAIDWDHKLALDVWYVDNRTLSLDLKILVLTAWKVLAGSGVSRPGQVSMDEFWGLERTSVQNSPALTGAQHQLIECTSKNQPVRRS